MLPQSGFPVVRSRGNRQGTSVVLLVFVGVFRRSEVLEDRERELAGVYR